MNNKKQRALKYLDVLDNIRQAQKQLFKEVEAEKKNAGFIKRLRLQRSYKRKRDALDLKADEIAEKYTMLLKSVKQFTHRDYLKYKDGLLDRKFVDFVFKD